MKVGIVGTGGMGNVHAKQYRNMQGIELGYFERNPQRGGSFQSHWNAHLCETIEELIEWSDLVDICLPTDIHKEFALKVIAGKKPLFLEKPVALSLEEAQEIVDAAEIGNVPLSIGQVVRFFPEYALARRMVLSGSIGKPAAIRMRRGGPSPAGSSKWFMDHTRSLGVLVDLAIHDFDWLRWTFGEVKFLYSRSLGAASGHGPDYGLTTLTFETGAVAHVESTWMDPGGFRTMFDLAGSEGLLEFDSRKTPALRTSVNHSTAIDPSIAPHEDPYYLELSGFIRAVKDGTPPLVTGEDGIEALRISLAALESAKTGKVVYLNR
ncbi:MAG: Gfo/Idh/MocA family oxidoreductase [Fimbriimonas sp.]|nr:Gfo/Idh/MocA family oxidoreductase [Fimbriimonas sp.]